MTFKMNNRTWEIKEVSQDEMIDISKKCNSYSDGDYVYGITVYTYQKVYICKDICEEQKRKTLMHELTHVYIQCFMEEVQQFDEEILCNISSCSHDMIHSITECYFKKMGGIIDL